MRILHPKFAVSHDTFGRFVLPGKDARLVELERRAAIHQAFYQICGIEPDPLPDDRWPEGTFVECDIPDVRIRGLSKGATPFVQELSIG